MTTKDATPADAGACLHGKVAVVPGAARGIGRAAAVAFAREGADPVGIDICESVDPRSGVEPANPDDVKETQRLIEASAQRCLSVMLDQRNTRRQRTVADGEPRQANARKILAAETPLGVPWDRIRRGRTDRFLAFDVARMVSGATFDITASDSARNT